MNGLRVLALVICALAALLATYTLARAQAPKTLGSGDAVGGDGTLMYTRIDRKVTIATYLNLRYYKFKD